MDTLNLQTKFAYGVGQVAEGIKSRGFDLIAFFYLPAYGGYCAFGVSVGKKFYGDPDVWEIVDGRLYLNLDNSVKKIWVQDIPGRIKDANRKWSRIKNKAPSDL